jgi:RND family efflux transporter MFP subunit
VDGRIVEIHPQLKKGAILADGVVLLRIDPTKYRLAIAEIEASIRSTRARIAELGVKEENTLSSLTIEERSLALSRNDLERKRALLASKNVSQAAVDEEERNVLAREQSVQTLANQLNLIPTERATLEAEVALYRARLADAQLDLERTTITAPFDGRVAEVRVERAQYANRGQVLAIFDGIDVSEVSAQLPIDKMMSIVSGVDLDGITPATVMPELQRILGLTPIVRLHVGERTVVWPARVARISDTVDPRTRTVGVIVAVDQPYFQGNPGTRPPLAKNMFVEVELRGRALSDLVVIPRVALQGRLVFVVGADDRLSRREVEVQFHQTNFAAIRSGLEAGERIVISDLIPAIDGMLLDPVDDDDALAALIAEAQGRGPVQ